MKESVKLESKGGGWYLGEDEGGQTVIRTEYMKKNKVSPAAAQVTDESQAIIVKEIRQKQSPYVDHKNTWLNIEVCLCNEQI